MTDAIEPSNDETPEVPTAEVPTAETETAATEAEATTHSDEPYTIDEIPAAYKDIDKVMDDQRDLVEVVHTLKQVLCVKG